MHFLQHCRLRLQVCDGGVWACVLDFILVAQLRCEGLPSTAVCVESAQAQGRILVARCTMNARAGALLARLQCGFIHTIARSSFARSNSVVYELCQCALVDRCSGSSVCDRPGGCCMMLALRRASCSRWIQMFYHPTLARVRPHVILDITTTLNVEGDCETVCCRWGDVMGQRGRTAGRGALLHMMASLAQCSWVQG
jgi:hypothetical protein